MLIATSSNRGQIVIPKEIRKALDISAGRKFSVRHDGENIILTPLPDNPVEAFCGVFKAQTSLVNALTDHKKEEKSHEAKNIAG